MDVAFERQLSTGLSGGGCHTDRRPFSPSSCSARMRPRGRVRRSMRGPWQGKVRCRTSENAVACIQLVRECSGTAGARGGEAIAESQIISESQSTILQLKVLSR